MCQKFVCVVCRHLWKEGCALMPGRADPCLSGLTLNPMTYGYTISCHDPYCIAQNSGEDSQMRGYVMSQTFSIKCSSISITKTEPAPNCPVMFMTVIYTLK